MGLRKSREHMTGPAGPPVNSDSSPRAAQMDPELSGPGRSHLRHLGTPCTPRAVGRLPSSPGTACSARTGPGERVLTGAKLSSREAPGLAASREAGRAQSCQGHTPVGTPCQALLWPTDALATPGPAPVAAPAGVGCWWESRVTQGFGLST